VDRHYDIQWINNTARRLLGIHEPAIGEDFLHLTRSVPSTALRSVIDAASGRAASASSQTLLDVQLPGGERRTLRVQCYPEVENGPLGDAAETVVVLLVDATQEVGRERALESQSGELRAQIGQLETRIAQLNDVNGQLLQANEELSTTNAELRATNEELLVANEESQAATEEVETLNEELQATNEELETLNEELQATVEELNTTNDDLQARSVELQDLAVSLEEQRRSAEAERARLQAVLVAVPDAFALVGRHAVPLLTNPAYDRLFGAGSDAVVFEDESGRPLAREDDPRRRAARGDTFSLRCVGQWPDGTRRQLEVRASPIDAEEPEQGTGLLVIRELRDGR
jgi:two-component system CheB/CheR fusion protein